jgi:Protein of unknown function (DUF3987)
VAQDWITRFLDATEGIFSADSFRLWTAITTVAAAVEKKIYTVSGGGKVYPNLYVVLAGPPGSGKSQSIIRARTALATLEQFHLGPDNVTSASFLDCLDVSTGSFMNGSAAGISIFHSMAVISREFGVFVPRYDLEFLSMVSDIFDNPPNYNSPRRTSKSVNIQNPSFTLLSGVTPDFLQEILPEAAWGQGFTSRIIFVYGPDGKFNTQDFFVARDDDIISPLVPQLKDIHAIAGEMFWTEPARNALNTWRRDGMTPLPTHGRLRHYLARRTHHLAKLSMISAISAGNWPEVLLSDFERAYFWLITAEETMPDIFRAMAAKSDRQIIEDLHYAVYTRYMSAIPSERKPVHVDRFTEYLMDKVPSERIRAIIGTAVASGYFRQGSFPNEYIPRPLNEVNGKGI